MPGPANLGLAPKPDEDLAFQLAVAPVSGDRLPLECHPLPPGQGQAADNVAAPERPVVSPAQAHQLLQIGFGVESGKDTGLAERVLVATPLGIQLLLDPGVRLAVGIELQVLHAHGVKVAEGVHLGEVVGVGVGTASVE